MVCEYIDFVKKNGYFQYRRNEQAKYWMYETINESLKNGFYNDPEISALLGQCEQQILGGEQTSFAAAQKLLDLYYTKKRDA
jgi:LAO/AO transport system kinase